LNACSEETMTASKFSADAWNTTEQSRWSGIKRPYGPSDVVRLRGTMQIEYTLAQKGAVRLWNLLQTRPYVAALGAVTGDQAVEQVHAGLLAIYADSSHVAATNASREGFFSRDSGPNLVRSINKSLQWADQIRHGEGANDIHWFAPVFADAEGGA